MESQKSASCQPPGSRPERWIGLALCAAMLLSGVAGDQFVRNRPAYVESPVWLPLVAALLAAAAMILNGRPMLARLRRALKWSGLLLMVWLANGLPLDLLRLTPLMPPGVDWPGLATRALALAAAVMLARLALARPASSSSAHPVTWYGYAAFVLALPYPVMRTIWVLGGTLGLSWPGAGGQGFEAWLACTPWLLAAVLSLLLVSSWRWFPRRLLLAAGWTATAIVAMIGPAACWSLVTRSAEGNTGLQGIAFWVPCLFYGSWFLWAIAAAAATRSYQLRTAPPQMSPST